MDNFQEQIYKIIIERRSKKEYAFSDPSVKAIWFTEILVALYPDYKPKTGLERARKVKSALIQLEKEKKIFYRMSEPPFYILYEDRDRL